MVQEVVVDRVLVQEISAPVRARLADGLALVTQMGDEIVVLVVVRLLRLFALSSKSRQIDLLILLCEAIVFLALKFKVLDLVLQKNWKL